MIQIHQDLSNSCEWTCQGLAKVRMYEHQSNHVVPEKFTVFSLIWIFGQKLVSKSEYTRFESDFLPYALLQFRSLPNYELRNSKWTLNVQRTGKVPEIFQVPEWDLLVIFVLDIHRKKPKPWKMLGLEFHIRQLWKSRLARHLGTGELHLGKIRLVTNWTILDP